MNQCPYCGSTTSKSRCPECGAPLSGNPKNGGNGEVTKLFTLFVRIGKPLLLVFLAICAFFLVGRFFGGTPKENVGATLSVTNRDAVVETVEAPKKRKNARFFADMPMYKTYDLSAPYRTTDAFGNRYRSVVCMPCWAEWNLMKEKVANVTVITDQKYERFIAKSFPRPEMLTTATVWAQIIGDGVVLWEGSFMANDRPVDIDIDISTVYDLTFTCKTDKYTEGTNPGGVWGIRSSF